MSDIETHDYNGTSFKLGSLLPDDDTSVFAAFEDSVPLLSDSEIDAIAKSGKMKGSLKFGSEYVVKQQGGSCNGWAGSTAVTKARVRRGLDFCLLSGAYLYSLINNGVDNGSNLERGMQAIQSNGIAPITLVPVSAIFRNQYPKDIADKEALSYKAFEAYAVRSVQGLFSAAALGWDVVYCVHVGNNFSNLNTRRVPGFTKNGKGNHAVSADGLVYDGEAMLDGVNSWGLGWGVQGRMSIPRGFLETTVKYHVFYAVRSATDGHDTAPSIN